MKKELYTGRSKEDAKPYYIFIYIALKGAVVLRYVLETAGNAIGKDCIRGDLHGS